VPSIQENLLKNKFLIGRIQTNNEQKKTWNKKDGANPYASLPRMVMLTYQLPETITKVAELGEFDGFDLNIFFKAEGEGSKAHFKYEDDVQKWLDLIRGSFQEQIVDTLKLKTENHLCLILMHD
jgi:hypothetical protein